MKPRVIGISGPSGSGKSTLAQAVHVAVPDSVMLQQDWYFKDADDCPPDANFCELRWLHLDKLIADVSALARGTPATVPVMDFRSFRQVGTQTLTPNRLVIVEGMTIFRIPELWDRFDARYYVDVHMVTVAERKRLRDSAERSKPLSVIETQLNWIAAEHEADAELRGCSEVAVLRGDRPVAEQVAIIERDLRLSDGRSTTSR